MPNRVNHFLTCPGLGWRVNGYLCCHDCVLPRAEKPGAGSPQSIVEYPDSRQPNSLLSFLANFSEYTFTRPFTIWLIIANSKSIQCFPPTAEVQYGGLIQGIVILPCLRERESLSMSLLVSPESRDPDSISFLPSLTLRVREDFFKDRRQLRVVVQQVRFHLRIVQVACERRSPVLSRFVVYCRYSPE